MIKCDNLAYSFPQKELYNDISFHLEQDQHCAFIGVSGSGKTTLIDIIMNLEKHMFDGKLEVMENCKIGYISQFPTQDAHGEITAFEYIATDHIYLEQKIQAICKEMETAEDVTILLEQYQNTLDDFQSIGGDDYESLINKQLNLAELMYLKDLKATSLSGGEFKLIQIIRAMLNKKDLLIMDEPDVFLDFENLNSLKQLINNYKGTILAITHSRYLLNHCFNKILHLENTTLQDFDGSYSDYNFARLQNKIELQELASKDTEEFERNEILIENLRELASEISEPAKGRALRARVKIQERLQARRIHDPYIYDEQAQINMYTNKPMTDETAISVQDYFAEFDEVILENVNFEIKANEKVAIIGGNGTGKTTLLRDIFKNSLSTIKISENADMIYLSQNQGEVLDLDNRVLDEFWQYGFESLDDIITYTKTYGFDEEVLMQKVGALSGGEKNILQLAKIGAGNANLLLLDEPTSHLDTYAQAMLERAIKNYNGSVLMISHDFYSIVNCMDYVLIIENKTVRKIRMRKFRQMIYAKHFKQDYLELERQKKDLEEQVENSLKSKDFTKAKLISEKLEKVIEQMH